MAAALDWREQDRRRPAASGRRAGRELGIQPGPELGRILRRLQEAAFTGEATDREQALELARALRENPGA